MQRILGLALALALTPAASQAAAPHVSARDFFKNPTKTAFQISPDGKWLSWMEPFQHRLNVFVQPVAGGTAQRITSETERDVAGYFWKGSGHIVYLKDFKGDENFHLVVVSRDGTGLTDLTPFDKTRAQIVDDLADDDHELLIEINNRKPEVFDAYRVNVDSKKLTLEAENPATSPAGSPITPGTSASPPPPTASTTASSTAPTSSSRSRPSSPPTFASRCRRCSSPSTTRTCTQTPTAAATRRRW